MADDTDLAIPGGRSDAVAYGDRAGRPLFGWGAANRSYDVVTLALFRKLVYMTVRDATERGLVFAILEDSEDPGRRLVYADWLEEHDRNDEAHAERQAAKRLEQLQTERAVRERRRPDALVSGETGTYTLASGAVLSVQLGPFRVLSGMATVALPPGLVGVASGSISISPISRRGEDSQEGP